MSKFAYDPKHALNAICPYFTMFPLEYPFRILKKYEHENPIVLDPFCGRGTTIYAARELGVSAWGIDSSPIAVAIARAKLASASLPEILALAMKLISKEPSYIPDTPFFRKAFHPQTLREICSLREGLLRIRKERGASALLRAAALGCLHGPLNKTPDNAAYFSNQMPRTFSSKPDYSVRFWKERNLKAPDVKVIDVLRRKLSRIKGLDDEIDGSPAQIIWSDSCCTDTFKLLPKDFSIVVTSPPYYGMRTYIQDQWLRLWFLGGPEEIDYQVEDQVNHNGQIAFIKSLASVWKNLSKSESDDLHLHVRFGSVPSIKSDAKMILKASFEEATGWRIVSTRNASDAHAGNRQAAQMVLDSKAAEEFDFHIVRA
jgi:hypothetical protein